MNASQLAGGGIKSIQRGTVTIGAGNSSASATISAVDISKSELRMLGFSTASTSFAESPRINLGSTYVNAQRDGNIAITISWEVTERY